MDSKRDRTFRAFLDFAGSPYALGDILTWNIRTCVEAIEAGCDTVDVWLLSDPERPSNKYQFYINGLNHQKYLLDLVPAFFTNPVLRNIHLLLDRETLELEVFDLHTKGEPFFPALRKYIEGLKLSNALYSHHTPMNAFWEKHGWVPKLSLPRGVRTWAENFLKSFNPASVIVVVHLRNRRCETDSFPADVFRDADFDIWTEFFNRAGSKFPEVQFLVVGRPVEWPRRFYRMNNVVLLKSLGYGLIEELAMIQCADLFVATNSGPAVMAVFSETPYLIFQGPENAKLTAEFWGVDIGATRLPFGNPHQSVYWGETSVEVIERELERSMGNLYPNAGNGGTGREGGQSHGNRRFSHHSKF